MSVIEYKTIEGLRGSWKINVYVHGQLSGAIKLVQGGFAYFPKGSSLRGDVFKTVREVQASLETEDDDVQ